MFGSVRYYPPVLVPPIPGTAIFGITFRAAQRGTVQLSGNGGDTIALLGVAFRRNRSITFDGLDFVAAPGHAISGTTFCENMQIVNCTFAANHRSAAPNEFRHALIVSENSGIEAGWHVHPISGSALPRPKPNLAA